MQSKIDQESNDTSQEKKTVFAELRENLVALYRKFEDWLRPKKGQPLLIQIIVFILKLPLLFLLILLSPVLLVVLLLVFMIAL